MDGMLFSKILQMSLIGCYSMLIVLLVRFFLRRIGRKYSYYLWLIVFLDLCIPFSIFSSFSLIPQTVMNFTVESVEEAEDTPVETFYEEDAEIFVFSYNGTKNYQKGLQEVLPYETAQNVQQSEKQSNIAQLSWKQILPWAEKIWLIGICVFALYSIGAIVRLNRKITKTEAVYLNKKQRIVELKRLDSPFLWGIIYPTIYLPMGMDEEEQKYIIAHENCHRKRKDHLIKIMIYAITVLHWFNPFVWIAYSLCCKDMEISCDESVLEKSESNIRKDYAQSLLKYAAKQNRYIMTPLTFGEPSVRSRIENVLRYRKRGVVVSVIALLITMFVAVGLLVRPADQKTPEKQTGESHPEEEENVPEISGSLRLKIINNGGELIQVGNDLYYKEGQKLYSDGKMLYATNTDDDTGTDYIYEYNLDGSGFHRMMEGTLVGISENNEDFYYLAKGDNFNTTFNIYNSDSMDVHQVYDRNAVYLDIEDDWVYMYRKDADGLYLERAKISEMALEENVLGTSVQAEEITCFYAEDYLLFAAGSYEGSIGYFNGDFYSYDPVAGQLNQAHLTDSDKFFVYDGYIYYQKYSDQGDEGNNLYRANFDLTEEEFVGESMEFLTVDEETGTLLVSREGKLLRISPDGKKEELLLDLADAGFVCQEYDKLKFNEVNIVNDHIYVKAERWGYQEGNGWRDSLIEFQYLQIKSDGSSFQAWDPTGLLEEYDSTYSFLSDPMPGIPCDSPMEAGWDLENVTDIREEFSRMSYIPEPGTEENTYLIGKTESYTLYGKGDFESMLLESNGKYSEVNYHYDSNYMILPELLEVDLDGDNTEELAIKLNLKHGSGLSVETFLFADFQSDRKLYVHQFMEEDFNAQLMEHLSYEKTAEGIQALVDGQPAGYFMENLEDMEPFYETSLGAQIHFYYIEDEIQISADIMFIIEEVVGSYWINNSDVTATVLWKNTGEFVLTDFRSRNRNLDSNVERALKEAYGTTEISVLDIQYDSVKMNNETLDVTATILPKGSDSYDYAEIELKRIDEYYLGGWEIVDITLEK